MATAQETMSNAGIENAEAIVNAANDSGLPLGVAVALIMKESGGRNVYGHDAGGIRPADNVTEDNFKNVFLPHVLAGGTSNGVGLCQITYPGYFKQNQGYAFWDPYQNALFGFKIIKEYLAGDYSRASLVAAGSRYNSGSPTARAATYGATFADLAADWTSKLSGQEANNTPQPAAAPASRSHTVTEGENLSVIAGKYGTTWQAIAQANNLANPDLIHPGQVLQIPEGQTAQATAAPASRSHTVTEGENLSVIAGKYGTTWQAIAQANNLANPDLIHPGQVLQIP